MIQIGGGDVSGRPKYNNFYILHVLCADLCMSYVQIYACVMCIAVQTGSGLALLALRPFAHIHILALTPSNNWMGFVDPGVMWIFSACCGQMEGPVAALHLLYRRTDSHI